MCIAELVTTETDEVAELAEPYCTKCRRYVDIDELRTANGRCPGCRKQPRVAVPLVALGKTPMQVVG